MPPVAAVPPPEPVAAVPPPEPVAAVSPPPSVASVKDPSELPAEAAKNAALEKELVRLRAQLQELEATLSDPQKFQEYQAEKAAQEFEHEAPRTLALEGIPFKGPADAPIRVVEFSDFLCPFCRNLASAFAEFMPRSQGRIAVFFKNYPLDQDCNKTLTRPVHDGSCELALGAICAQEQGKFWQYHDRIFSQPPEKASSEDVVKFATEAGLDGNVLRQCLSSAEARAKLDRDLEEGRRMEVNATPTVFVNGRKLAQLQGFIKAIESESKRLGLQPPSP